MPRAVVEKDKVGITASEAIKAFFVAADASFTTNLEQSAAQRAGAKPIETADIATFAELETSLFKVLNTVGVSMFENSKDKGDMLPKAAQKVMFVMQGGNHEHASSEYGFMSTVRFHYQGLLRVFFLIFIFWRQ